MDPDRARRRLETGYIDQVVDTLEEAMTVLEEARSAGEPKSVGPIANASDIYAELVIRGVTPDVVTDQTPAHDPLSHVPHGMGL